MAVTYPASKTSRAEIIDQVNAKWDERFKRAIWVGWGTDSINDVGSDDARLRSWHGSTQLELNKKKPTPGVGEMSGENYQTDYASVEADKYMAAERVSGVPTGAKQMGFFLQGVSYYGTTSNGVANAVTQKTAFGTSMHVMVKADSIKTRFKVFFDNVLIYDHANFTSNLNWQKIMTPVKTRGNHTLRVEISAGFLVVDHFYKYDGSETKGINHFNGGRSGISLNQVSRTGPAGDPTDKWARYMPQLSQDGKSGLDIYIMSLATNNGGDSEAAFDTYLDEHMTALQAYNPNVTTFLALPQQSAAGSEAEWLSRLNSYYKAAAKFKNTIVTPLTSLYDSKFIPKMNDSTVMSDTLHPRSTLYVGDGLYQGKPMTFGYMPIMLNFLTNAYWNAESVGGGTGGGGDEPTYVTPVGFSNEGDSISEEMTVRNAKLKAAYSQYTFVSRAKGGWLSAEAAAHQGGEPALATFPNNTIPAGTTAVTLTSVSPNLLALPGQTGTWSEPAIISGVLGTVSMTKTTTNSIASYVFQWTRATAGSAVTLTGPAKIEVGQNFRDRIMIASLGRNDAFVTSPAVLSARWAAMKAYSKVDPKLHIWLEIPTADNGNEGPGTANRAKIDALNARMRQDHPENYLGVATYLRSESVLRANAITPTTADIADIADGYTPISFRADNLHYNQAGYDAFYPMTIERLSSNGIVPASTGGTGGGTAPDTTAPTLTMTTGTVADNAEIPVGGSVDVLVTAVDTETGVGATSVNTTTGDILGAFTRIDKTNDYKFTITHAMVKARNNSIRYFGVFKDNANPANKATTSARNLTAAVETGDTTTAPTLTSPSFSTTTTDVNIAITAATTVGTISLVSVSINTPNGVIIIGDLARPTSGNRWLQFFPIKTWLTGSSYFVETVGSNGVKTRTADIPYTITRDTTAPTGSVTSPAPYLSLGETLFLKATAKDATAVTRVDFASNNFIIFAEQATMTSGTAQDGVWEATVPLTQLTQYNATPTLIRAKITDALGNEYWTDPVFVSIAPVVSDGANRLLTFLNAEDLDWALEDVKAAFDARYADAANQAVNDLTAKGLVTSVNGQSGAVTIATSNIRRVWNATTRTYPTIGSETGPVWFISTNDVTADAPAEMRLNFDIWTPHVDAAV